MTGGMRRGDLVGREAYRQRRWWLGTCFNGHWSHRRWWRHAKASTTSAGTGPAAATASPATTTGPATAPAATAVSMSLRCDNQSVTTDEWRKTGKEKCEDTSAH